MKETKDGLAARTVGLSVGFMIEARLRTNPIGYLVSGNPSIGGVGLDTAWELLAKRGLSDAARDKLLDTIGELAFIQSRLSVVRFKWRPAPGLGPQCGEWKEHVEHLRAILSVAERAYAEQQAERAKWNSEDEENQ